MSYPLYFYIKLYNSKLYNSQLNKKEVRSMGNKVRRVSRGQSTLEYVLVIAVIIAAVALAASQFLRPAVNTTVQQAGNYLTGAANKLQVP